MNITKEYGEHVLSEAASSLERAVDILTAALMLRSIYQTLDRQLVAQIADLNTKAAEAHKVLEELKDPRLLGLLKEFDGYREQLQAKLKKKPEINT